MEGVYKELDETKAAMEKLTADYHVKSELAESLRKAHNEQIIKIQEAKMEIEKQAQELNAKADEIYLVRQMYEELKSDFQDKESVLRHLNSTNNMLRTSYDEKLLELERQNKELVSVLSEANDKTEDQELKISACKKEIEALMKLLSVSQKKCNDAEQRALAAKELRERDDMLLKLEQENNKTRDQLKWKKEQFDHLKDAHKKLQDQFRAEKDEWVLERSTLLDEICSLQTKLDSQTRALDDLHTQCQMCNQALAQEESRRKLLEIQISESKACYENVVAEYQEARSAIGSLTVWRDEDIAALRDSLATKHTLFKEMEFQKAHLEQENWELRESLKELQEAQINQAGASASLTKLHQKLKGLEQAHKSCSANLKAKETEWSSQTEKMEKDLNDCLFELNSKDEKIWEFQKELEGCHSSLIQLKMENEEILLESLVLKSALSEAHLKINDSKIEVELYRDKAEKQIALLMEQLEKKNSELVKARDEIEKGQDAIALLSRRVGSSYFNEQQYILMQKEVDRYKEMLEESSKSQVHWKEQVSQKEDALRVDMRKVVDALDKANSDLADKIQERSIMEFELQRLKSVTERLEASKLDAEVQLKNYHEEIKEIRKEVETAILAKMETEERPILEKESFLRITKEKDMIINEFRQEIDLFEHEVTRKEKEATVLAKMETEETFKREKESFLQITKEKDKRTNKIQQQIILLEQEFAKREIEAIATAEMEAEDTLEKENEKFLQITEEKDDTIDNLQRQILSLEQELTSSVKIAINSELAEKQSEISTLYEAWEKFAMAQTLAEIEIHERNLFISELEQDVDILKQKLEVEEKSLLGFKQRVVQLEVVLEMERLEKKREIDQIEDKLQSMESTQKILQGVITNLTVEMNALLEVIANFSLQRDELLGNLTGFCDQIGEISSTDAELMRSWERIKQKCEYKDESVEDFNGDDELVGSNKEEQKKREGTPGKRSPLQVINS